MMMIFKPRPKVDMFLDSTLPELKNVCGDLEEDNDLLQCAIKLTVNYYENLPPLTTEELEEMRKLMLEEKLQMRSNRLVSAVSTTSKPNSLYDRAELKTYLAFHSATKQLKNIKKRLYRRSRSHIKKLERLRSNLSNFEIESTETDEEHEKFVKYITNLTKFKISLKYRKSSYLPISYHQQTKLDLQRQKALESLASLRLRSNNLTKLKKTKMKIRMKQTKKAKRKFQDTSDLKGVTAEQILKYFRDESKRRDTSHHALKFKLSELHKKLGKMTAEKSAAGISKQNQLESHTTVGHRKLSKVDFDHLMIENSEMREKLFRMNSEVVGLKKRIVSLKQLLNTRQTLLVEKISSYSKLFKKSDRKEKSVRNLKREIIVTQNSKMEEMKQNKALLSNSKLFNVPKANNYIVLKRNVEEYRKKIIDWERKGEIIKKYKGLKSRKFKVLRRKKRLYCSIYGSSRPSSSMVIGGGLGNGHSWNRNSLLRKTPDIRTPVNRSECNSPKRINYDMFQNQHEHEGFGVGFGVDDPYNSSSEIELVPSSQGLVGIGRQQHISRKVGNMRRKRKKLSRSNVVSQNASIGSSMSRGLESSSGFGKMSYSRGN